MSLLIFALLTLQEAPVAQEPPLPPDVPVKKHKKKKQDYPPQEPPGAAKPSPEDLERKPEAAGLRSRVPRR
jgi:hypothetical protein